MNLDWNARQQSAACLLAIFITTFLFGCKGEVASSPPPQALEIGVVTVTPTSVPDEPEFIGQAEASRIVEIRSQVTGIIQERFFQEGREVKKGDRLYRIDEVPFRAAVVSAKGRVAQSEARFVHAKQDLARVKPLLEQDAVSQKDFDDAVAEQLAAKAALETAHGDLDKAKFDLDNTVIAAPISGLVERTRVYEGRLVSAQTDLLTVIHQIDPMYVVVNAPEAFLIKRREDTAAKKIQHPGVYKLTGTLIFLNGSRYAEDGVLDLLDVGLRSDTGERPARVTFPNHDGIIIPGQFVTVRFHGVTRSSVMLIPQRAVLQGPKGPIVYVVDADNNVQIRDVKATAWQGTQWLVEDGLVAGERVVVDSLQRVVPGTAVKPVPVETEAGSSGSPPSDPKSQTAK
ncbi:RND efflux system, membrane fusion protein [Nitrospira japonica]|uniref:RND efflux system, membrane fusion protein n=1 Tax=Nitrospira japonica TaxID=1325564 RepID=A0A1W1I941_9BACT|nr:efflux RND transporter periplasmic adaptor subunit [Nitrospira japonica]SLM49451.1 RND efflux system, membrane fusion protein [Nitrospira japonica]